MSVEMDVKSGVEAENIVKNMLNALGSADMETFKGLVTNDIVWIACGDPEIMPWAGEFQGIDAVLKMFGSIQGGTNDLKIETKWTISTDDRVVMLIRETAQVAGTGESFAVDTIHEYTIRDKKVAKFQNYYNPLPLLKATFGEIRFDRGDTGKISEEVWIFFENGRKYHHAETFRYEYDQQGKKIKGQLINPFRNLTYDITYLYDDNNKGVGEMWVNSLDSEDVYDLTYNYSNDDRVSGGKGTGKSNWWEFAYNYDRSGKKITMDNKYANGNTWSFEYQYDSDGKCILGQGKSSSGLSCLITYKHII